MPNHITNILTIQGNEKQINHILTAIQNDEHGIGSIDFNKINPMPPELDIPASSEYYDAYAFYLAKKQGKYHDLDAMLEVKNNAQTRKEFIDIMQEKDPEILEKGKQYAENIQKYGVPTWYEWRSDNSPGHWGTKWNAYGFGEYAPYKPGSGTIRFNTAWSSPEPILQRLSEMFPNTQFQHRWADEDMGVNVGMQLWENGDIVDRELPDAHSKAAYEMAADIRGVDLSEYEEEFGGMSMQ